MTKMVLLDFASEVNRGDAIMQEVFYKYSKEYLRATDISVISVYGVNQDYKNAKHFDLTARFSPKVFPNLRNSGNKLFTSNRASKILNIINLAIALIQLVILYLFKFFIGRPDQKAVLNAITDAKFIIWNGRNFRNRKGIGEIYDILCMVISPCIALILKKKVYTIGVSVWPLRWRISKIILSEVLRRCEFVSVRETASYNYCTKELKLKNVRLDPDLSFASMPFAGMNNIENGHRTKMFLTIVDWTEDGESTRQAYIVALKKAIIWGKKVGLEPVVVPQVHHKWEDYRAIVSELTKDFEISVIDQSLDHEELLSLYSTGKIILATRMHSAIFALSEGCRAVALSYDSGAKWNILSDAGLDGKYIVKMQELEKIDIEKILDIASSDITYWKNLKIGYQRNKKNVGEPFNEISKN